MTDEHEEAARQLTAELRRLADTILDLEARGQLLSAPAELLKLLGDARSRLFAWEVRLARLPAQPVAPPPVAAQDAGESARVVDEALQREQEARQEWIKPWERGGEGQA